MTPLRPVNLGTEQVHAFLRETLDTADVGTFVVALSPFNATWDARSEQMFGLAPGTYDGRLDSLLGLIHPEDRPRVHATYHDLDHDETGGWLALDFRVRRPSGGVADLRAVGTILRTDGGAPAWVVGLHYDVTIDSQRNRLRQQANAYEAIDQAIFVTDLHGTIQSVNSAFTRITGFSEVESIGQNPRFLSSGQHHAAFYAEFWRQLTSTGAWVGEIHNRRKNGAVFRERLNVRALHDDGGDRIGYVAAFHDLTEVKAIQARVAFLTSHDRLTELPNRSALERALARAMTRAAQSGRELALLFLDLDDFKAVNDAHGHGVGDALLVQVSRLLDAELGPLDMLARVGGDEFAVMIEGIDEADELVCRARALIDAVRRPLNIDGHALLVGLSVGISRYPDDGASSATLIARAHSAMFRAKAAGGNVVRFFAAGLTAAAQAHLAMRTDLARAIESDGVRVAYQPQLDLATGRVLGVEALARWHRPGVGDVSPGRFIPVAERSGLIRPLGLAVLRRACADARRWIAAGYIERVAVNVSSLQLADPGFVEQAVSIAASAGLPPGALELELTESVMLADPNSIDALRALGASGVRLAIDDFGTGFSSMRLLKALPFNQIKLDQSFVRHGGDAAVQAIARAIVSLGLSLELEVLAEGVETARQEGELRAIGCNIVQGYRYARPMPADATGQWLIARAHAER